MVQGQQQHVRRRAQAQQGRPQQGARGQVERRPRLLARPRDDRRLARRRGQGAEVGHGQGHRQGGGDHLLRAPLGGGEGGAQGLVAGDDGVQGPLQGGDVQGPGEPEGGRDGVDGGAGGQLVEEPQALLGEGERESRSVAGDREHRGRVGSGGGLSGGPGGAGGADAGGEAGHGGGLEQGPQGQLHPEGVPHPGHHLGRQQGVAPQGEEVRPHPHPLQAQDVGPDGGHGGLVRGAGGDVLLTVAGDGRGGGGEGLAVDLPVGAQGQGLQGHEETRHHVGGEVLLEVGP